MQDRTGTGDLICIEGRGVRNSEVEVTRLEVSVEDTVLAFCIHAERNGHFVLDLAAGLGVGRVEQDVELIEREMIGADVFAQRSFMRIGDEAFDGTL